ncbi:odorant receptor 67c-like isoform X2 [Venturia canescens]|uniref:odorant receptor 67c-like isoform X2 n=1 Tax=Venturia canescens TaxID=32260 RepID=UPI001C9CA433|nr:odorant receptor 67c-like isoform X2 [Venturia canescens]
MIFRLKLIRLGENEESTEYQTDTDFRDLRTCIARHSRGIEFAELIESTYSITFSLITVVNVIGMSLTGIQILISQDDLRATVKWILYFGVELIHLFMECYIPQILMDHSINIRNSIYGGKWYNISSKSQKLLTLMMLRCNKPCKLTISKICNMSLQTFVSVCRKTWSYFMVLRSFQ